MFLNLICLLNFFSLIVFILFIIFGFVFKMLNIFFVELKLFWSVLNCLDICCIGLKNCLI